jgi:hypothetical protein
MLVSAVAKPHRHSNNGEQRRESDDEQEQGKWNNKPFFDKHSGGTKSKMIPLAPIALTQVKYDCRDLLLWFPALLTSRTLLAIKQRQRCHLVATAERADSPEWFIVI